jgi:cysteine desulfurase/selenocysteine lyase
MSAFDPTALKPRFPILAQRIGANPLHYLDNAATAQVPTDVLEAMHAHETTARANVHRSVHTLAERATQAYEAARETMATFLNAKRPEEVVFTSGATAAINLVANAFGATLATGDEVLISAIDHHSNIVPWQMLRDRAGIVLKPVRATADGRLDVHHLSSLAGPRTRLIAVTHASNVTGAVTPVAEVVAIARSVGARVLLDGCQMAPHGPLDVQALGVDFYALSGHKMFGPNGIGALWAPFELLESLPPFLGGGEMIRTVTLERTIYAKPPMRFEAGTPPIAQAVGLAAAARFLSTLDITAVETHLSRLAGRVLDGLAALDGGRGRIRVIGPEGLQGRLPVISFDIAGAHPHDICQILDEHGVALRGGHHCAQPLMEHFDLAGTTRASLALYNDDADVDALLVGLDDALRRLAAA